MKGKDADLNLNDSPSLPESNVTYEGVTQIDNGRFAAGHASRTDVKNGYIPIPNDTINQQGVVQGGKEVRDDGTDWEFMGNQGGFLSRPYGWER